MKTAYSEGWDAGFHHRFAYNPYLRGWTRNGWTAAQETIAHDWQRGFFDGREAAHAERAAEDDQRKCDAREGF